MEGAPSGSNFECVIITMENHGSERIYVRGALHWLMMGHKPGLRGSELYFEKSLHSMVIKVGEMIIVILVEVVPRRSDV